MSWIIVVHRLSGRTFNLRYTPIHIFILSPPPPTLAASLIFYAHTVLFFVAARNFAAFSHCPRRDYPRHKP